MLGNTSKNMVRLKSYAKVNLALDILGKDEKSGYHFVDTVICEVMDLYDEIEITPSGKLTVETDIESLNNEDNLAYKAAKLIGAKAHIKIKKNIPLRSGLGGGSSNAASVLKALGVGKSEEELLKLASKLGMDVPIFILGGVCHATHYGESVERIKTDLELSMKITLQSRPQTTRDAYAKVDLSKVGKDRPKTAALIKALKENNLEGVIKNLHNDFETTSACLHHLSGSGPSYFELTQG